MVLNKQQTGYYRVNYDETNWRLIAAYLNSDNFQNINPLNRAQLIDDAYNLARTGLLSYSIVFDLLDYVSRETDYIPLYSFYRGLSYVYRHLITSEYGEKLKVAFRRTKKLVIFFF